MRNNRLTIAGTAVKGIVKNASVAVTPLQADGSCNSTSNLASGVTDDSGNYALVYNKTDGIVCLTVSANPSGQTTMFDEATNADVSVPAGSNFNLVTILPESKIANNSKKNALVSPFSKFVARRLQSLLKTAGSGANATALYRKASKEVVIRFGIASGLTVASSKSMLSPRAANASLSDDAYPELDDIILELENPASPLTAKFTSILVGFSYLAKKHGKGGSFSLDDLDAIIEAFSSDFEDGIFDGKNSTGQAITIGSGAKQIIFSGNPLTTLLLPATVSYIQAGGRLGIGRPNAIAVTITVTQITNQTQYVDNATIVSTIDTGTGTGTGTGTPMQTVVTPTLGIVGGTYNSDQSVTISTTTPGATIYFTLDGSLPSSTSTQYTVPISVAGNGTNTTIRAIAVVAGMLDSAEVTANYIINYNAVSMPTFNLAAGTYTGTQTVTISSTTVGAIIHYTTDGSAPTCSSATYSTAISVSTTSTLKAIACNSGMLDSSVASASYTINIAYTVGGNVTGVTGGTVVLQNNLGNNLNVSADGGFTFSTPIVSGGAYSVTVLTQPAGKICAVTSGTGNIASVNVANVTVTCATGGTGTTLWAKSVTSGTENSAFYGVSLDSSGSPYAVGYITGTAGNVNFGTGAVNSNNLAYSIVSVKYNSTGTAQWTQTVSGGSLTSEGTAAGIDSSGNFFAAGVTAAETKNLGANALTGAFAGTNFLTKYNSSGTNQWVTAATAGAVGSNTMKGISADSTGNMYLSGYTGVNGTFTFSGINMTALVNNNNPILIKFNSSGVAQWIRTASTLPAGAIFARNTVDPSGNIITGGYLFFNSAHTFSGVNVTGAYASNANAYIIKYDSSGNVTWAKSNSTAPNESQFSGFAADSSGNIYAVGYINTAGTYTFGGVNVNGANAGTNAFIVKYDSNGNVIWARSTATAPGASQFEAVSVDSQGNAYAVGRIFGNGAFSFGGVNVTGTHTTYNALIVKYNSSGAVQYAKTTTVGANSSIFYSVKTNDFGNTYAAGVITGNGVFNFGSGSVNGTNSGGYSGINGNAILVKYE